MAYRAPTFNLTVNIWRWANWQPSPPPSAPPDVVTTAQLRGPKSTEVSVTAPIASLLYVEVVLPMLTDVRPQKGFLNLTGQPDLIEIPAGSGRYYAAVWVEDVAKGFPNEYRTALCSQLLSGTPIP